MSGPPASRSRKRTKAGVYTSDIGFEALAATFHMPSNQACEVLGVGLTIFKRLCRKFGLHRWPYRALKKQGKLMQQSKQVSTADLQHILSDCKVPFEWQSAAAAAAATNDGPSAAHGRTTRSGSGSGSDLMVSDEEDDTGWEPKPSIRRRGNMRQAAAAAAQPQEQQPSWYPSQPMWGPGLDAAAAPFAAPYPADGPVPTNLLEALAMPPPAAPGLPPLRPTARPADPNRIEQLQRSLMPAQQDQRQPLQLAQAHAPQGNPLAVLMAGFSSVSASDRQQVALLLKQLAKLLDQQSRAAAVQALVARLQQPPPGTAALTALLQQVQGGGSAPEPPAAEQTQQPTPFSLARASSSPAPLQLPPPAPHADVLAALLSATSGALPQSGSQASPQPSGQMLLGLLGAASASGSLPPSLNSSFRGELLALPDHLAAQLHAVQKGVAQQEPAPHEEQPQPTAAPVGEGAAQAEPSTAAPAVTTE